MAFNLFKKEKENKKTQAEPVVEISKQKETAAPVVIAGNSVLKNFYVSEKAARLEKTNQYMFAVTKNATKSEIKKQVTKQYNVRVVAVNILNMPQKIKTVNRREGVRPGFKKAIVTLVQGDSIDQAKA